MKQIIYPLTDERIEAFFSIIPELGADTKQFLKDLSFRPLGEIFDENILIEMATTYFRDLYFNGNQDETQINRMVNFERHQTLNWVRKFQEIEAWDDTDTST